MKVKDFRNNILPIIGREMLKIQRLTMIFLVKPQDIVFEDLQKAPVSDCFSPPA